jgi:peptidoglycan/xylan/chitin deacetylase (PgdA/CDA1 family)
MVLLVACAPQDDYDPDKIMQEVLQTGNINGSGLPAKTVVLTYDDGPDDHTIELATYLKDEGIRATFFVNGRRFCKTFDEAGKCTTPQDTRRCTNGQMQASVAMPKYYPEAWLDMLVAMGHRIANHTQDHCHLPGQSMEDLQWEVKTTQDILDKHICDNVYLLRAPFGEWNGAVVMKVNAMMGFTKIVGPINWDVDGNDWDCWQKGTSPTACANGYFNLVNSRGKGILLMHDRPEFNVTYEGPLLMTKILVPRLKAAGYKFGTMDDVLKITPRPIGCPNAPAMDAGSPGMADDVLGPLPDAAAAQPDAAGGTTTPDAGAAATGGSTGSTGGTSGGGTGGSKGTGGDSEEETGGSGGGPRNNTAKSGGCAVGGPGGPDVALPLVIGLGLVLGLRKRFSARRR